jgi:3-hydroxy-3-methylglutaryl CoA synthase
MDAIESRLQNANLAAAIDAACKLPANCLIRIDLSQGSGAVTLLIDGEDKGFVSRSSTLSEKIREAIDYARCFQSAVDQ